MYRPLQDSNEIRLVTIEPLKDRKKLTCKIEHHSIDTCYIAVSYTWGDSKFRHKIRCNDTFLDVTTNCRSLLKALRDTGKDGPFWIDALCIDQSNVKERNRQVAQMGTIFNNASTTIVYLGDHTRDSLTLQQALQRNVASRKEFEPLFRRPWFSRTWVVQEMLLSRRVLFLIGAAKVKFRVHGHFILPLKKVLNLVSHCEQLRQLDVPLLAAQEQLRNSSRTERPSQFSHSRKTTAMATILPLDQAETHETFKASQGDAGFSTTENRHGLILPLTRLVEVLELTRDLQCQDPRDKIFAIQSLFVRPIPEMIAVDYSRELEQIYSDLTWFCIDYGLPEVLQTCESSHPELSLSSWVIDWRKKPESPLLMSTKSPGSWKMRPDWSAGWQPGQKQIVASRSGTRLTLRGVFVGHVVYTGEPSKLDCRDKVYRSDEFHEQSMRWSTQLTSSAPAHLFEQECRDGNIAVSDPDASSITQRLARKLQSDWATLEWSVLRVLWSDGRRCINRRPIILRNHPGSYSVGLAPKQSQIGDEVCVFLGFPTPFVLRSMNGESRLVGQCAVQGKMYGEAVSAVEWETVREAVPREPLRDFEIS